MRQEETVGTQGGQSRRRSGSALQAAGAEREIVFVEEKVWRGSASCTDGGLGRSRVEAHCGYAHSQILPCNGQHSYLCGCIAIQSKKEHIPADCFMGRGDIPIVV